MCELRWMRVTQKKNEWKRVGKVFIPQRIVNDLSVDDDDIYVCRNVNDNCSGIFIIVNIYVYMYTCYGRNLISKQN